MFDLAENQKEFYYQMFKGEQEGYDDDGYSTGESQSSYSNPIKASAMISENTSEVTDTPFGRDLVYDKMISTVQDLPIDEYSKLFIDVVPVLKEDGSTDTKPDYVVKKVAKGIYQKIWAIQKIDGYENN